MSFIQPSCSVTLWALPKSQSLLFLLWALAGKDRQQYDLPWKVFQIRITDCIELLYTSRNYDDTVFQTWTGCFSFFCVFVFLLLHLDYTENKMTFWESRTTKRQNLFRLKIAVLALLNCSLIVHDNWTASAPRPPRINFSSPLFSRFFFSKRKINLIEQPFKYNLNTFTL